VSLLPNGRGSRKAAKRDERRKSFRRVSVIAASAVGVLALVAGYLITSGGGKPTTTPAAAPRVRTQHTLLLSITDPSGSAYESALLAHDGTAKQGVVVLVPANLQAEVAGRGSMALGDAAKVGPATLGDTLSDMINVTIDGDWNLSAAALAALVDHLGGITADVPTDISVNGAVVVAKGNHQQLTGAQASALATFAAADEPSAGRLARFQNVLTGLMAKLGTDPTAVATTIAALSGGSTLAADKTATSTVLAGLDSDYAAQDVAYQQLATTVLDTGDQTERLAVDGTAATSMVNQYFKRSVPPGRTAGRNRVIVFNGTGALGLGESARKRLTAHGLVFVRSANQPGFGYKDKTSVVLVPDATPDSIAAGKRVATALGLPASDVETATVDTTAADVLTILGRDYKP
jgi:anionic cell wall polymer biosynthesis LytR-Cps2A-Psr (LCP) family protein